MLFIPQFLLIILAGIMNGSFIIPARYLPTLPNEKIWVYHSIIGLALIPWIILAFSQPETLSYYISLSSISWRFLIVSGAIFGIGQVCFAYAIVSIGVALSFVINLSIGVTIGSLFVVFYRVVVFSIHGYLVLLAVLLIISSLILYYFSGKEDNHQSHSTLLQNVHYRKGWLLASLTGITSGLQNIAFIMIVSHNSEALQGSGSFWVWPPFLLSAAIPMAIGFLYTLKKYPVTPKLSCSSWFFSLNAKSLALIGLMGVLFTGSLALYSIGMDKLSATQQVIGWPTFMIAIILISQVWGWLYKEPIKNKFYQLFSSTALLIIAIILLALAALNG